MIQIEEISYNSPAYRETLELRNRVMRQPLGLDIHTEDFSFERDCVLLAASEEETGKVVGMGSMSHKGPDCKVEYLCVDPAIQGQGLGRRLLERLEGIARNLGAQSIELDARVSAQPFYEQAGYQPVGEIFLLDYAPVEHILMRKHLR